MKTYLESSDLKTNEWLRLGREEKKKPQISYDKYQDVLYMYVVPIKKTERILTFYIDRYAGLLFRAEDQEVIGICFEAFCRSFFPAHINKRWSLKDTGVVLNGIRDLNIRIQTAEQPNPAPHYIINGPIDKSVSLEPVFA